MGDEVTLTIHLNVPTDILSWSVRELTVDMGQGKRRRPAKRQTLRKGKQDEHRAGQIPNLPGVCMECHPGSQTRKLKAIPYVYTS